MQEAASSAKQTGYGKNNHPTSLPHLLNARSTRGWRRFGDSSEPNSPTNSPGQPGELWPIRQPSSTCAGNGTSPSEQPTGYCTDRSWLVAQCLTDDSEPDSPD